MSITICCAFAQPGVATAYMGNADMGFDPETGEYVPREQFIDTYDDHRFSTHDREEEEDSDGEDEDFNADLEMEAAWEDRYDELSALVAEQEADETTAYATSTKGTHPEFRGKEKLGPYRSLPRGKDTSKDRRLRANGSAKTRARDTAW